MIKRTQNPTRDKDGFLMARNMEIKIGLKSDKGRKLLLFLLLGLAGTCFLLTPVSLPAYDDSGFETNIFYIPSEHIAKAPGYSREGMFLPLSELLSLAEKAESKPDKPLGHLPVYCTSLELKGALKNPLRLEGLLHFVAPDEGWSAALVDDGSFPWFSQDFKSESPAFLARVNGKTFLYARGPAKGSVSIKALFDIPFVSSRASLSFGALYVSSRIDIDLEKNIELLPSDGSAQTQVQAEGLRVSLFPAKGGRYEILFKRIASLDAPPALQLEHHRTVASLGGVVKITDELVFKDKFSPDRGLTIPLPSGLKLLSVETPSRASIRIEADQIVVSPREKTESLPLVFVFSPELDGGSFSLAEWKIPAQSVESSLKLDFSQKNIPLPKSLPSSLIPIESSQEERRFVCWGPLPSLEIALVPRRSALPPSVEALMKITRNEASIDYTLLINRPSPNEILFSSPPDWTLTEMIAEKDSTRVPFALNQKDKTHWRLNWSFALPPKKISFTLHRVGTWGAPHSKSEIPLPVVFFDGPRPSDYEISIHYPDGLKIYPLSLGQIVILPAAVSADSQSGLERILKLRCAGNDPKALLSIEGREPDVRSSVVSVLSIGEERTLVRTLLSYQVRTAPTRSFQFILPSGTGSVMKIDGSGIRDKISRKTDKGEEWTIITQNDVMGKYELILEWTLETTGQDQQILAPEIYVKSVTSSQGFLVLEGSETLKLAVEMKNLAEADPSDLPQLPWKSDKRLLAVYRYVEPPFHLSVKTEKYQPDPPLKGLIKQMNLITTVSPEGRRFTQAVYSLVPMSSSQFFEISLPEQAKVWAVLVNNEGAKPATRKPPEGRQLIMIPLPSSDRSAFETSVNILYEEKGNPLRDSSRLILYSPDPLIPVNQTVWNLNLPPGFEYLSHKGALTLPTILRQPLITFFRSAYYPRRVVLLGASTTAIILLTFIPFFFIFLIIKSFESKRVKPGKAPLIPEKAPPKPKPPKLGCSIRFIELLIVVAVIAILASIATPNFLEAQVRSKVSRVKADLRSMATAIESYYVDNNTYPPSSEILWQGPVKYMTAPFYDPFADVKGTPFIYVPGAEAVRRIIQTGIFSPEFPQTQDFWLAYSVGPDTEDNNATIIYDPTNGTVTPGDIIRIKDGEPQHYAGYKSMREEERRGVAGRPETASLATGISPFSALAPQEASPPGSPALQPAPTPAPQAPRDIIIGDRSDFLEPEAAYLREIKPKYLRTGILSLSIEIPRGGIQKKIETLGRESQLEIRLLEENAFLRLRFLAWLIPLLVLWGVWIISRRHYKIVFLFGALLTLLIPLLKTTPWVVFYNTAFMGIALSLSAPILSMFYKRYTFSSANVKTALLVLLGLLIAPQLKAQETSASGDGEPVRIVVPYSTDRSPRSEKDPMAFISREDFTRLWNEAHKDITGIEKYPGFLAEVSLEGSLSPERSVIEGVLSISAANLNDIPTTIPLRLSRISLKSFASSSPGVFLESGPEGLLLNMEKHWMGGIKVPFEMPCEIKGSSGKFRLEYPDAAAGFLRISFPYAVLHVESSPGLSFIQEKVQEGTSLVGSLKPGLYEISWDGLEARKTETPAPDKNKWRAEISTRIEWTSLSAARAYTSLKIEQSASARLLPAEIRFFKDPKLLILSAQGDKLEQTSVQDNEILFRIRETDKLDISLEAMIPAPPAANIQTPILWDIAGLRAPDGVESHSTIVFEISDQIEMLSVKPENLERKPTLGARSGFTVLCYESGAPAWKAKLELKSLVPVFNAEILELAAPGDGFLHRVIAVSLTPKESIIQECRFAIPEGLRITTLKGSRVAHWVQAPKSLFIAFAPHLETIEHLRMIAVSDLDPDFREFDFTPVDVMGAAEKNRSLALLVSPDKEITESQLSGAAPRAPEDRYKNLIHDLPAKLTSDPYTLRAYTLANADPLRFKASPVEATALTTIYNHVTVSDGLQSLDSVLRADPRRGRLRQVSALLYLTKPDPLIPSRLQAMGPVRDVRTEKVSDLIWRVTAELMAPYSQKMDVRFQLEQPANTDAGEKLKLSVLIPDDKRGARSLLLLRRAFEGELTLSESAGARVVDPSELRHPDIALMPLPSDQCMELLLSSDTAPSFLITRHKREEALRAVVEILRQRTILTPDGVERNELEIVLQNKSEQFLKIALPYPKSQVSVYEVQVASRVVKTTFTREGDRDILLVPLIRSGLLEPELTVRVAYTVANREALKGKGVREQKLPEVLGNIPVAQSAMVLMMPSMFKYYDFKGTMNQVELVDIEVDEALRQAKVVEKISEALLYSKGETQAKLINKLQDYKSRVSSKVSYAQKTEQAFKKAKGDQDEYSTLGKDRGVKLAAERGQALEKAQQAVANIAQNVDQLAQVVETQQQKEMQQMPQQAVQAPQPAQPQPVVVTPPPAMLSINFPRAGDVFVFRQLQGTGSVRFQYVSRQRADLRKDILVLLVSVILIGLLFTQAGRIFSSRRNMAGVIFVLSLIAILARFALDVFIPGMGVALLLYFTAKRKA